MSTAPAQRRHPVSMTARLVALFALVAMSTFAGVGSYLYHALYLQLERRDDDELLGKIRSVNHLVQEAASLDSLKGNRHALRDIINGHDQLLVQIEDMTGAIILASRATGSATSSEGDSDSAPRLPPPDRSDVARLGRIQAITLPQGSARFIASLPATRAGEPALVMMARTSSDRMQLLADYRTQVWLAASIGTLLATLLGYFLVRSGLRPLRQMAAQTHAISAHRLDTRLDLHQAPQELHDIVTSFNAMLDRLHRSFEQLTQFSADLAHDLRTPLNNLFVQSQVILAQPRAVQEYQALISSSIEEYERLSRMMESMLFLARADHADVALDIRPLDLASELHRIAEYFEGIAEDAGVTLQVDASGQVRADAMLLRRAVSNLVANAIRFTAAGGTIRLAAGPHGDATVVSVSNPGSGIAPALAARIFDRFYRADPARSTTGGSSGLGLAIVRSIMRLHGGQASVHCTPAGATVDTVFVLSFPAHEVDGAPTTC